MTTDTVGGVWTFTRELATGLLERGCAVSLVSFGRMPSASQQSACELLEQRFEDSFRYTASNAPLEWMDQNACAFEDGARVLHREADLFDPDLMHSNQFCFGALQTPFPRIITAHSDVLSWAKYCRSEPLPATDWLRNYTAQVQAGLNDADAVVAPTQWMLHALAEGFSIPAQQSVIYNGLAITPANDGPRKLQAITAGRIWDEAKDVRLLEHVTSPIPILVAGETRDFEPSLGAAQAIGLLSHEEMLRLLRTSSMYICTSRYEPFGLAPLEAALCGCAVIARDIPSLREVWADGALYFTDAISLSRLLQRLASDPSMLEAVRERSMHRASTYTRDRMVDQYIDLYQHTLTHSSRMEHVA